MTIVSPNSNLRDVLAPLADPLNDLITQLGLLGGEESWQVPWLADLGEALGLGFLPPPLADDMSMLAGLALMADLPEMAFPTSVLPEGLAGLGGAALPLAPEWARGPAEGRATPSAQPPGFDAIEAAAGQAGLLSWPAWPTDGFGAWTGTAAASPAGVPFDLFATGLPAAALAGIGGWVPPPVDTFGFDLGPGPGTGAATLDSLFGGAAPDLGGIGLPAGLMAPPARPGSFDALLAALSSAATGPEAGAAPSPAATGAAAPALPWPDLTLALPDNLMAAAQAGALGPTDLGGAVSPRLLPDPPGPGAAPGVAAGNPAGLLPASGMDGLPFASIANALDGILAQASHEPSAPGHEGGVLGGMSAPADYWSPPEAAAPLAGALPSIAMNAPGGDSLYAGGLTGDAMARLLPSLTGVSRGPDGGPGMPEAMSALTGLLAPSLRPATAPLQPGALDMPASPPAPMGPRADAPAGAAGQGRRSALPNLLLNHRELERIVLHSVNRAATRPSGGRQHPNPKTLKRPGSSTAAS